MSAVVPMLVLVADSSPHESLNIVRLLQAARAGRKFRGEHH
jgi:hypothetical protein